MHRFYAESAEENHTLFSLNAEDSYHAVRVLRLQKNDEAEIIFNRERYLAVIEDVSLSQPAPVHGTGSVRYFVSGAAEG